MTTIVYTDGACSGNPGRGGWAWVVPDGAYAAGHAPHTTNQRMEITAALRAVEALPGPLEVRSDSTYVVNCFRDRWWQGWLQRGWVNSQRKPVANRDLWEPLVAAVRSRGDVEFRWVKGHSGDRWNDVADRLAVAALREQVDLRGDRPPDQLGPPDQAGGAPGPGVAGEAPLGARPGSPGSSAAGPGAGVVAVAVADRERPLPGHGLVVLGSRPEQLTGFEDDVRARLVAYLTRRSAEVDGLVVVTGLRQGTEQLAAEAALEAGVPYVAILPFPDPDRDWPDDERERFGDLLAGAAEVRVLEPDPPPTAQGRTAALSRRDRWLAASSREAVLVWDGIDPRLARLHGMLVEQLHDDVLVLDPGAGRAAPAPRNRRPARQGDGAEVR